MATTIVNNFISPRTPFEMVIKTDNLSTGSTADNQFRIPTSWIGPYNYKVDWGDGVVENYIGDTKPVHTYSAIGTYNVKIWGIFAGVQFSNSPLFNDNLKLLNVLSGDNRSLQVIVFGLYRGCANLQSYPIIKFSGGTTLQSSWQNCSSLTSFPLIDTSSGANFSFAWSGCSGLTSFPLIDTSSGTSFRDAWYSCSGLTSFPLIDTSSGTNFQWAWFNCSSLTSFPLIDTSSGTNFYFAWRDCSSLTSFPLLDTSSGTDFTAAWRGCSSLTSFPLIDTSSGTDFQWAWYSCSSLTSFPANFFDTWVGVPFVDCFVNTWLSCNALTAQSVENILVSIDTSGQSAPAGATGTQADITITYNVATGALSSATNTAITNLKAKGWKPYINNVYV